eukprot:CAMPEP_0204832838 /NCGR_PEP_ID=MMETSP1346-20131115/14905_1 /ASSEMBLY_ACC=CAM_ASM_000771 /TAXON_ID=215587 /ORGANISM="Aplanochytrium stocchinoi, Strain GSBS06" /LENGTH=433 /DNA_ID=CAMNT_0051964921 /DNA_START=74 /DNA_END=1375 /DNA_ORIENTATION=-
MEWMSFLSSTIWGKCEQKCTSLSFLLLNLLEETLPESYEDLVHYEKIVSLAKSFEVELETMGLVNNVYGKVLTPYVKDIEDHIAQKQRTNLLAKAREILIGDYLSSIVVEDETEKCSLDNILSQNDENVSLNPPSRRTTKRNGKNEINANVCDFFVLPTMRVSVCATKIVELVHDTMAEATKCTSAARAGVLYGTCRDILELFRILTPVVNRVDLEIPKVAMQLHNDCLYISQHCLTMAHIYRRNFPRSLSDRIVTVDQVPLLRDLGDKVFRDQVRQKKRQIEETFSSSNYYELESEAEDVLEMLQSSTKECLKIIKDVSSQWNVLPVEAFDSALKTLKTEVLRLVIEVLTLQNQNFRPTSDLQILQLRSLLKDVLTETTAADNENAEKVKQIISILTPTLTGSILKDEIAYGNLSNLTESEQKGLCSFLFSN